MDRVKNIGEVIIGGGEVLMELIEKKRKSGIVLPDNDMSDRQNSSFGIVVAVGCDVTDIEVGDIVLKTRNKEAPAYEYKDKTLLILSRYNIAVALKPTNFEDNEELST